LGITALGYASQKRLGTAELKDGVKKVDLPLKA